MTNIADVATANVGWRSTRRSTTGSATRSSRTTSATSATAATMLSHTMSEEANQSSRWPRSSTNCSAATPATSRTRPGTSTRRTAGRSVVESGTNSHASSTATAPTGTLM